MISDSAPTIIQEEPVPFGEVAVHRSMHVDATAGTVGTVDERVVDADCELITHVLLRKGHLWGAEDVAVPIAAIEGIFRDSVKLTLDKQGVKAVPPVPIKRHTD